MAEKNAENARRLIMTGHVRGDEDAHVLRCLAKLSHIRRVKNVGWMMVVTMI